MKHLLAQAFEDLRNALIQLDYAFSPTAQELVVKKHTLEKQRDGFVVQRDSLLKRANIPTSERTVNMQGFLAEIRQRLIADGIKLNSNIAGIEQNIAKINKTIEKKTELLKKLNQVLQKLEEEKKRLQQTIDDRGIIKTIIKAIFGDSEKEKLQGIEQDISKKYTEQYQIQTDCNKLKSELSASQSELSSQKSALENAQNQLELQNQRLRDVNQAMEIENSLEQILLSIASTEVNINNSENHAKEIRNLFISKLDVLCKNIRKKQPQIIDCPDNVFGKANDYPDMFAFGRLRLFSSSYKWHGYLPRLLPFPLKQGLRFDTHKDSCFWINSFLLRAFQCLPCAHLSITVIDPMQLGKSLPSYQTLLKNKRPFVEQRFLTRSDEIETVLNSQLTYIENLIQQVFIGEIKNWEEYNRKNSSNQLDYRILIIFDVPEQLTEKSCLYLSRILEHGPKCGVVPLLTTNFDNFDERKYYSLRQTIEKQTWENETIYAHSSITKRLNFLQYSEEKENLPSDVAVEKVIEKLSLSFKQLSSFSGSMNKLWADTPFWSGNSGDGLFSNIGWTVIGNKPVQFSIGGVSTEHHTLLGGKSGSGKSNLLHILIHSLCHKYSPSELNLYLLDYKQGTEFNIYSQPYLPHAKLVATQSDVDYGITLLKFLVKELERRSMLFKATNAVTDYREFRKNTKQILPRILLIIDEFQMLFEEEMSKSQEAEKALVELLRQGRAYGIHLLLATQTLKGLQNQSLGQLISQMGCRMALSCSEEDSSMLLGSSNWEAAKLQSPPEGILNNENGNKSANIKFNIPFADKDERLSHQTQMRTLAKDWNLPITEKIFNGEKLPVHSSIMSFKFESRTGDISLLLGESLDFDTMPFIINLKKENLLIVGYDSVLREGLATSIMYSLMGNENDQEILIYQAHGVEEQDIWENFKNKSNVKWKDDSWDGLDLEEFAQGTSSEKFIIIDSLDFARMFQVAPQNRFGMKPNQPPSPAETLRKIIDNTISNHVHLILFVESHRRFAGTASSVKDLLNSFDLRIGFGLDEDDAGTFVNPGGYGKFKGISQPNKAVFVNRKRNQLTLFRPFISEHIL